MAQTFQIQCPACKGLCQLPLNTTAKMAMTMPKIFLESQVIENYHTCELCHGQGTVRASKEEVYQLRRAKKMIEAENKRLRESRKQRSKFR